MGGGREHEPALRMDEASALGGCSAVRWARMAAIERSIRAGAALQGQSERAEGFAWQSYMAVRPTNHRPARGLLLPRACF